MSLPRKIGRNIIESPTGQVIIGSSKKMYLPGLHGFSVYEVWSAFVQQLKKSSLRERASGISFNIVMAIPPTLIFIFTLIPYLPISKGITRQLFALIRDVVPGQKNNSAIINFLDDFLHQPRNGLLSVGLIVSIYFSSNAMMGILRSFDKNYSGFLKRNMWSRRKAALKLTIITFLLVILCLLLLIAQRAVLKYVGIDNASIRMFIANVRWLFIFLLTFSIVAFIYRHGPAVAKKWPLLTPGSVFATTAMIIATGLVSFWVNNFSNYNKLYGSIGAIFILMSFIFVNSFAVLMGFELNVTLSYMRQQKEEQK
jgi:membrane protein